MSSSYYDDRRTSTRDRRRSDDYYDDSTTYANTRDNQRSTTAIVKRRSSDDYDEELRRDFSPGGGYYRETITRKSGTRPAGRARSYDDDRYYEDDRSYASSKRDSYYGRRGTGYSDRRRSTRYDSDESSRSPSPKPKKERRKSMPEEALEAVGLGGLAATIMGKKNRSRSRSSSSERRSGSKRGRARSNDPDHRKEQIQQALKAAVIAGAVSAFRSRHEEGGWGGEKGKRVLTAAVTAGGVDGFINRDKDPDKHKFVETIGSALAGVATDRVVNGPRSRSRGPNGRRSSSESGRRRSRSRLGTLAAGGTIGAAAKQAMDSFRGRSSSRGRDRDRSLTPDSYDSRSPPRRKSSRRRSSVAGALSKVGLGSIADKVDPDGARERSVSRGGGGRRRSSRPRSRYSDEDDASYMEDGRRRGSSIYDPPSNFNGRGSSIYDSRDVGNPNSSSRSLNAQDGAMVPQRTNSIGPGGKALSPPPPGYVYDTLPHQNGDPETDSDSDLGSSSDDDRLAKKGRKRMLLTGGLATVATIHAGHSIQQSVLKRHMRHEALKNGTISKEEAEQHKVRDRLQEAASVGLAALGVKGAYSEWKEMKEHKGELEERQKKNERHKMKREARRMKERMVGMNGGHTNSAPTLSDPFYAGEGQDQYGRQQYYRGSEGPYMTGANPQAQQAQGPYHPAHHGGFHDDNMRTDSPQYYDENPYGNFAHQQGYAQQGYHDNHYGNPATYPPPPAAPQPPSAQGGTGFPPPPVGQPPPPSQGR